MNYIKEINAFHKRNIFDPLSSSAVSLWFTLMHFQNLCGWKKQFSVAASQLQAQSGLKNTSFKTARRELQDKNRIIVTNRGSNRAAIYQMISQVEDYDQATGENNPLNNTPTKPRPAKKPKDESKLSPTETTSTSETSNQKHTHKTDCSSDHTPDPFIKQNEIKNKKDKQAYTAASHFYKTHFSDLTPYISKEIKEWTTAMNEEILLHAMKKALDQNKITWRYVRGILKAWEKKGIRTVEQARNEEMQFSRQRSRYTGNVQTELVPDWFYEQKKKPKTEKPVVVVDPEKEAAELKALLGKYAGGGR
ncbi:DnaD domain-containing protein [Oceanobacillus manasiensis]|uniref:DnaD domain-containing protein n=1 Tax=Oceanobacillus manasiensis TaxID=586413 RepID=UPI0006935E08|nr:DnaD domain protein [Oceanobacillus manasiensis]